MPLLNISDLQITAVCDPQKNAIGYLDWSKDGLCNEIRDTLQVPDWMSGGDNTIPGGRDNAKSIVDTYYSKFRNEKKAGCRAYADFRELLEKEKDLNAVKVMTPDHLHGLIGMAAIKRGINISMHKPISNRLSERFDVIETAKKRL